MISSHEVGVKWEQMHNYKLRFVTKTKWNGKKYSLDNFTGLHRSSFVALQEVSGHINFQVTTENSQVGFLIDNISKNYPDPRTAVSSVRINNNGRRKILKMQQHSFFLCDPTTRTGPPIKIT